MAGCGRCNCSFKWLEIGKFVRNFTLPENVASEQITAQFKDGVLELTIPKVAKAEPRRIEVLAA